MKIGKIAFPTLYKPQWKEIFGVSVRKRMTGPIIGCVLLALGTVSAVAADPPVKLAIEAPVEGYTPVVSDANIAPTLGTMNDPNQKVEVVGHPRMSKGHPCTLWDQEDLERYRALVKTDTNAQTMVKWLVGKCEERLKKPLDVPVARKGPDGKWMWPGEFPKNEAPFISQSRNFGDFAYSMQLLATAYALTGEAKYGEFARKLILAYAENFPRWARQPNAQWHSANDGRVSFQFLNDGIDVLSLAWGYDLIHDLPSFTKEDRDKIRDDLFRPLVAPFFVRCWEDRDYLSTPDNRSAICATGVLVAGYANDDQDMVDFAMHGHAGTKLKPCYTEGTGNLDDQLRVNPKVEFKDGGIMGVHFSPQALLPDGLWVEGAPGYTIGIAGCGLFADAEVLWHHGVDLYRYRNGALKRLLDAGILLSYPGDPKMPIPALRDSGRIELVSSANWYNNEAGSLYYAGYKRYRDPRYLPIVRNGTAGAMLTLHGGPTFIKENVPQVSATAEAVRAQNVNFYETGYGVLRITEGDRFNSLLMQFCKIAGGGHDHPSQLGIDLYAFGDTLMPFPGMIFPYNDPLDPKWYWTTLANSTLVVDQDDQLACSNRYHHKYWNQPMPTTPQMVYAPALTLGMQRGYSNTDYPGTTIDRSLFTTSRYMADLFGGFCSVPRIYDLAWHFTGTLATDLPLTPLKFQEPIPNGYNALDNVRHAATDKQWSAAVTFHDKPLRFWAAAEPTDVIVGDGHLNGYKEHPPTILERRAQQKNTLFGSAMDLSGDAEGYVKGVSQEGGLEAGYGLLKVQTVKGTDLCFTAYRPGTYKAGALETDALQAFLTMDGNNVQSMYLAGGKTLKLGNVSIERSEPGLAYVEKLPNGTYIVANPSSTKATVTVTLPGVGQKRRIDLAGMGQWSSAASAHPQAP